jgi:hypothetical protein
MRFLAHGVLGITVVASTMAFACDGANRDDCLRRAAVWEANCLRQAALDRQAGKGPGQGYTDQQCRTVRGEKESECRSDCN